MSLPRIAQPVYTEKGEGWIIHESWGALVGFIRKDVTSTHLEDVIGPHVTLRPLRVHGTQWRQCCLMPGVGHVER